MAEYLTYNKLIEKIPQYLNRYDDTVVNNLPFFIMLAERRISRDFKILGTKRFINGTLINGENLIAKPNRWLKTSSFAISVPAQYIEDTYTLEPLFDREITFCQLYWPNVQVLDKPEYYADFEYDQWYIVPTPDKKYNYTSSYFEVPVLIDESNSNNFYTDELPDLLLYGCLTEACGFLKDITLESKWGTRYAKSLEAAMAQNQSLVVDAQNRRGS